MKKSILLCLWVCVAWQMSQAQVPNKISYQAVVRNTNGTVVSSSGVGIRLSVLQNSQSGTTVYAETQAVQTNAYGLFKLNIGDGNVVSGNINSIDWSTGVYFLKSEIDPAGGINYIFSSTTQLLSVPFALYAKTAGNAGATYTSGLGISISGGNQIVNTLPNVPITLKDGGIVTVSGSYPNFTITGAASGGTVYTQGAGIVITGANGIVNAAPDIAVSLTGVNNIAITGSYPNFTLTGPNVAAQTLTSIVGTNGIAVSNIGQAFSIDGGKFVQTIVGLAGIAVNQSGGNYSLTGLAQAFTTLVGINGATVTGINNNYIISSQNLVAGNNVTISGNIISAAAPIATNPLTSIVGNGINVNQSGQAFTLTGLAQAFTTLVGINGAIVTGTNNNYTVSSQNLVAGSGISITGTNQIINTAPNQTLTLLGFGGTTITGSYPSFNIASPANLGTSSGINYSAGTGISISGINQISNTSPNIPVSLSGVGNVTITGNYPNYGIYVGTVASPIVYTAGSNITISGNAISAASPLAPSPLTSILGNGIAVNQLGQAFTLTGLASLPTSIVGIGIAVNQSGQAFTLSGVAQAFTTLVGINGAIVTGTNNNYTVSSQNLVAGSGISITGTNQIINTAPNQTLTLLGFGGTTITGSYPNLTINSAFTNAGLSYATVAPASTSTGILIPSIGNTVSTTGNAMIWDNINQRLGIGSTNPLEKLSIYSDTDADIELIESTAGTTSSSFKSFKARPNFTAVVTDDYLAQLTAYGYDGSGFVQSSGIYTKADGNVSAGQVPGRLEFITANTTLGIRMVIKNDGNVGIGTIVPIAKLDVLGNARITGPLTLAGLAGTAANLGVNANGEVVTLAGGGSLSGAGQTNGIAYYTSANTLTSNRSNLSWDGSVMSINGIRFYTTSTGANSSIVLGNDAGNTTFTGSDNNFFGYQAGYSIQDGDNNNFLGYQAGYANTSGRKNNFIGYTGISNTTGNYNNFMGYFTGYNNVSGSYNNYMGVRAGYSRSAGDYNIAIGYQADMGANNLTNAIAIGKYATASISNSMALGGTGIDAINVGIGTGTPSTTLHVVGGARITNLSVAGTVITDALGNLSVSTVAGGGGNTLLGINGSNVQPIGYYAFNLASTSGVYRINGIDALRLDGNGNLMLGKAGNTAAMAGNNNIFIGSLAGANTTSASENIFIGYLSGQALSTGVQNVFLGAEIGQYSTNGYNNVLVGYKSGFQLSSGNNNVFTGNLAGANNNTGTNNVFSGSYSGQLNSGGSNNVALGYIAGSSATTANGNVYVGAYAGRYTTGSNNIMTGYQSGLTNTTGSNNIILGANADVASPALSNAIAIGYTATVAASNMMALGGTGANAVNVGIGTGNPQNSLDVKGEMAIGTYAGVNAAPANSLIVSGNVGIGITSPNAPLQFPNSVANRKIVFYDFGNNDNQFIGFGTSPSILRYQVDNTLTGHVFYAGTSGTTSNELMRIQGTGNVGIGTSSPGTKLSVAPGIPHPSPTLGVASGSFSLLGNTALYGLYSGVSTSGNVWFQSMRNDAATAYGILLNPTGGNVGIGTTAPGANLDIYGEKGIRASYWFNAGSDICGQGYVANNLYREYSTNTWKFANTHGNIGGAAISFNDCASNAQAIIFSRVAGATTADNAATLTESMRINNNGFVGIGTNAPAFPLDINGSFGDAGNVNTKFFNSNNVGSLSTNDVGQGTTISVRASGGFLSLGYGFSGGFYVTSDERIKRKVGVSDSHDDLFTLMKLKVVDYKYVDSLNSKNVPVKGVFAQQVEAIYPQAVTKQTNFIPNIYAVAEQLAFDETNQTLKVTMNKSHGLTVSDKVKLISNTSGEKPATVVSVNGNSFTVNNWTEKSEKIFVFGKEVNDFRIVDYDRIFILGISAIQELNKKLEVEKAKNMQLELQIQKMEAESKGIKAEIEMIKNHLQLNVKGQK